MIRTLIVVCLICLGGFASPALAGPEPATLTRSGSPMAALSASPPATVAARPALRLGSESRGVAQKHTIASLAQDLSYLGAVLLTAHDVLASVRAWTDVLEYTAPDGSQIEITNAPKGMGLMLRLQMPFD